ncbi:MAG: iron dependent repressor, metal binding and dimerization domain protein, partial [Candidatus Gracilibacteria bacterium]|nr:iron dependent repressor, metal binding and dimerization domain protein [Candidatus Gracilibacteria bacterium]
YKKIFRNAREKWYCTINNMNLMIKDRDKTWKYFRDHLITHSAAHYLMALHELLEEQGYARLSDVAKKLDVSLGSLSTSMKPLLKKKLILQDNNKHLLLSQDAKEIALHIEETWSILTHLFHDILGIDKKSAEIDACKIEHLISPESSEGLMRLIKVLEKEDKIRKKIRGKGVYVRSPSRSKRSSLESA